MRREEEDREREFAIEMAQFSAGAQRAILDAEANILGIRQQIQQGNSNAQDAANAIRIEILKLAADPALQGQNLNRAIELLKVSAQLDIASMGRAQDYTIPAAMQTDLATALNPESIPEANSDDALTNEDLADLVSRVESLTVMNPRAAELHLRQLENILRRKGYRFDSDLTMPEEDPSTQGQDVILGGNADGGSIDLSFNKLVPQP